MEEISYVNYSSTVRGKRKGGGMRSSIAFLFSLLPVLVFCGIFVASALVHLYIRNQILKYSYEVPIENRTQKVLLEENKVLKSQLSALLSPAKIEKYAKERLHMRYPEPQEIIEMSGKTIKKENNYIGITR